jgi:hypothetical protein
MIRKRRLASEAMCWDFKDTGRDLVVDHDVVGHHVWLAVDGSPVNDDDERERRPGYVVNLAPTSSEDLEELVVGFSYESNGYSRVVAVKA